MKRIAILIDEMYEDSEFIYPYYRLLESNIAVDIVGERKSTLKGKHGTSVKTTHLIADINSYEYDGVYIPGGYAPERLRKNPDMIKFVRSVFEEKKPLCAVCHGPALLISAEILRGRKATAYPSLKGEMEDAGAFYTDKNVEKDENIITAKDPKSLPEMMKLFLSLLKNDK